VMPPLITTRLLISTITTGCHHGGSMYHNGARGQATAMFFTNFLCRNIFNRSNTSETATAAWVCRIFRHTRTHTTGSP